MWEVFADDPDQSRAQKFGRAMSAVNNAPGYEPYRLLDGFPWGSIGKGIVVNVGGSHGRIAIEIAEHFPQLDCVVQDLPEVVEKGKAMLPSHLTDRVTFMAW